MALKNQQASIQGLETQIGQFAKLISERPQGSLPSNTESNPREQLNAITIQDEEGLVAPEPEPRQETVVSKGKGGVDHNDQKSVCKEYKPRVPYPNATRKDRTDEQFGKFLKLLKKLHINLPFIEALSQMPNAVKFLRELLKNKQKLDEVSHVELNATHKPRTHDKPKPCHDELNVTPNQLKVGDKVLLDAVDPRIATCKPSGAIPLAVLSIFPYGTVKIIHPKFDTFKGTRACLRPCPHHEKRHSRVLRPCENRVKFFLSTGCDKWPRPCDVALGKSIKPTRACYTPVSRNRG
ncbi:hypothetical protein GOBAR_AA25158 [Gossypium barbadense]|uniref:Uncharacterized protein n=1 Tax=Gossypium barbadense TaxID=3634 RepID=A0A2P5WWP1_GOSBA|nr:hypothetical protein GOBAR_AA25158 [Gossypium barbadense]